MLLSSLACALILFHPPSYRDRFPLPDRQVPSGCGITVHLLDPSKHELQQIASIGYKWIRTDLLWYDVERNKGTYKYDYYDWLTSEAARNGIRIMYILDYGNKHYQEGAPRSPEARAAYCRFVESTVRRYQGKGILWEMWNEPNIQFWEPKPNVSEYITLATQAGDTIRRATPDEWLIGPATSGFDWEFLASCFRGGLLKYFDAVSVHPYRSNDPETAIPDWQRLRGMVDAATPAGKHIDLISSEWSYTPLETVDLSRQAAYFVRNYLGDMIGGANMSVQYEWKDNTDEKLEKNQHMGLVDLEMREKPNARAIKALANELRGFRYVDRVSLDANQDFMMRFVSATATKYVYWTVIQSHVAKTPAGELVFGPTPQIK